MNYGVIFMKKKLSALGKKLYWFAFNALYEKTYPSHGYSVHYLYQPGTSDTLIVAFSAFAANLYPTYNYVRTLWGKTNCHLLFIKDDFVHLPSAGVYYLGKNGDLHGMDAVCALIEHVRSTCGASRVIGVGSSKGGTAALLFGLKLGFDELIIGTCQYSIGSFMQERKPEFLALLTSKEQSSAEDIAVLDSIMPQAIMDCRKKPLIYLHYSNNEYTYEEHIVPMLRDLHANDFRVIEDVESYPKHTDVPAHYVPYLQRTLQQILNTEKQS